MKDQRDKTVPVKENLLTRRQMLGKTGLALAAITAASIPIEALGQKRQTTNIGARTMASHMAQNKVAPQGAVRTSFTPRRQSNITPYVGSNPWSSPWSI